MIARLTQHPEILIAPSKTKGQVYKPINDMPPSSPWDAAKRDYVKYLVLWQQKFIQLLKSILDARLQMKLARVHPKIHRFGNTCNSCRSHLSDLSGNYHPPCKDTFSIRK